jgi:hypothetical protein
MLSQTNEDIKQLFLKKFTAELILNSKKIENKQELEQKNREENEIKNKLKEIISKPIDKIETHTPIIQRPPIQQPRIIQIPQLKVLNQITKTLPEIPEPGEKQEETGSTFDSVKSALLPSGDIDFGKITPFIRDQVVSSLECRRAGEKIMIKKLGQTISTEVKLNETEINSLIKAFSEKTRIPLTEGILKARFNNLEIFAVISKFSTSRFIITKNITPSNSNMMNPIGMPNMNRPIISQNPFAPKNPSLNILKK